MSVDRDRLIELIDALVAFEGVIIVEGKKDVRALATRGIDAIPIDTSVDTLIEGLAQDHERILILTDGDAEGRKLHDQARIACERVSIKEEPRLRRMFFATTKLRHVEGFGSLCVRYAIGRDTEPLGMS